jgi:ComEC/Rec2-related protein
MLFISSLISIHVLNSQISNDIFSGQDNRAVDSITARVLKDSREISGAQFVFPINVLSAVDINSTSTSSSGKIVVIAKKELYKGQILNITKKKILLQNNSFIFIKSKNILELNWGESWESDILKKRADIFDNIKQRIKQMGSGPGVLFSALFTGIKDNPNNDLFTSFKKAGASHILALSGMHLGIISFGIMMILKGLVGKRIGFIITFFVVIVYVFLVNAGPSLIRAVIMFVLIGSINIAGKKIDIFHILIISFIIQILLNSESAYTLSFQLSYLALAGIILLSGFINRKLPGFIPGVIRAILSASISAQLFTAPLILNYFGVLYPVGIISGIILVPMVTLFIWIGITGLLPVPGFVQRMIYSVMDVLYELIKFSSGAFSLFPHLHFSVTAWIFLLIILFYLSYILIGKRKEKISETNNRF